MDGTTSFTPSFRPEFMSLAFDYVATNHSDGSTDYGTWHGGNAPLNTGPGRPAGHYIGRILRKSGPFTAVEWYACPDDGDHSWAGLRWTGAFTSRRDAALWLAGYRENSNRRSHEISQPATGVNQIIAALRDLTEADYDIVRDYMRDIEEIDYAGTTRDGRTEPRDPELFARTAPAWNCVSDPEGPHYLGAGGTCQWCGKSV